MPQSKHLIKKWRGKRENYEYLVSQNSTDQWTRYSVIEDNSTITEYFGNNLIYEPAGQILPVKSVIENIESIEPTPYDRYLVGNDNDGYQIYEYFIDNTQTLQSHVKQFDEKYGVRVKDQGMKNYVYVDGHLITYDDVDCGDF